MGTGKKTIMSKFNSINIWKNPFFKKSLTQEPQMITLELSEHIYLRKRLSPVKTY